MSLPQLLLVDDSEAILAYEKATLGNLYSLMTATTGREALNLMREVPPAAVLLDLSMPEMNGEQVLQLVKADPALKNIPIIIVSSEAARGQACVAAGAAAFLQKPIRADDLRALVGKVLEDAQRAHRNQGLAVLFLSVADLDFGLPLSCVQIVLPQLPTRPLAGGPPFMQEMVEVYGEPMAVLDIATRFNTPHTADFMNRMLVIVADGQTKLALSVDRVRDPEELTRADVVDKSEFGGYGHGELATTLRAVVRTATGPVAVIEPFALMSAELLESLPARLLAARAVKKNDEAAS